MKLSLALSLFPLLNLAVAVPQSLHKRQANSTGCATGVHMIVCRASTEAPGPGAIGAVATQVMTAIPGSSMESVDYPATLQNYTTSEALGVSAMTKLIVGYAQKCPTSKIALLGYSQGAQVIGDVMCGTTETGFNSTQPLDAAVAKKIISVVQMGDPTHVPNQPQDVGTSTKAGLFPRQNMAACGADFSTKTASYCNDQDEFCDSGNSLQVHLSYIQTNGDAAATFLIDKVNAAA